MINQQDLNTFGATVQRAEAAPGASYWKLVEARHANPNREFGGDHYVYIEAVDEKGKKLRGVQARVERGGQAEIFTLDKGLGEPGTNCPLWKGNYVHVSMQGLSDKVGPLHGEHGLYKEGDLYHHTWYLLFQRAVMGDKAPEPVPEKPAEGDGTGPEQPGGDGGAPTEPPPAPPANQGGGLVPESLHAIRAESWRQIGVSFNRDSAFARYARLHALGAPLTNEYDIGHFRAQGFTGGIVYARIGDWENVAHVAW